MSLHFLVFRIRHCFFHIARIFTPHNTTNKLSTYKHYFRQALSLLSYVLRSPVDLSVTRVILQRKFKSYLSASEYTRCKSQIHIIFFIMFTLPSQCVKLPVPSSTISSNQHCKFIAAILYLTVFPTASWLLSQPLNKNISRHYVPLSCAI